MQNFSLSIPTKVYFGRSILESTLEKEKDRIRGNILIVTTGRSLIRLGYVDNLVNLLKTFDTVSSVHVFDKISANPQISEIQDAVNFAQNLKISVVVGFGGGSAIDAAKAVAAGIYSSYSIKDIFYKGIIPEDYTLPIVAIPTTAGTGSELSKAAIVSDSANQKKGGIRGEKLYPTIAIVDSVFTESVPLNVTMETGFDVFAHAIESYLSLAASEFTRMLSLKAAKIVCANLPLLFENLSDIDARNNMSYASMIMGINLGNASTCLPHRMQYPIGAHTNTSHGSGLAAIYPAWLYYEFDHSKESITTLFEMLFGKTPDSKEECYTIITEFIKSLKLPVSLKDLGVTDDMITKMVAEVSGNIKNDPASIEEHIIEKIYKKSYQGC